VCRRGGTATGEWIIEIVKRVELHKLVVLPEQ
jgi:hypothetical protein